MEKQIVKLRQCAVLVILTSLCQLATAQSANLTAIEFNSAQTAHASAATVWSLSQILNAVKQHPDVRAARQALTAAQGDIVSADRAPTPTLNAKLGAIDLQNGVGGGNVLTQKRIDKSVGVDWTWERGDKRTLRTQAARSQAEAAGADVQDVLNQQMTAAINAYYDLALALGRQRLIQSIERSATEMATTAQRRVSAGDLAAQEAARVEIEAKRAQNDASLAQLEIQRASLALLSLLGRSPQDPLAVQPIALAAEKFEASDAAVAPYDPKALVEQRADVQAASARVRAAQMSLDSALALKKADVTWGASIDHIPGTSTRQVELRMQMPLQLGSALGGYEFQGEIARAQASLAQAEVALDKTQRLAHIDLQRLAYERTATMARAQSYRQDVIVRAQQVEASAELAYRRGALSLIDLLDARRTLRTTQLESLAASVDAAKAQALWQLRTQPQTLLQLN